MCVLPSRKNVKASAVCRYSLSVVQEAFEGPYMEMQGTRSEWKDYSGKIPQPRPGTVSTHAQRFTTLYSCTRKFKKRSDPLGEEAEDKMRGNDKGCERQPQGRDYTICLRFRNQFPWRLTLACSFGEWLSEAARAVAWDIPQCGVTSTLWALILASPINGRELLQAF